MAYLDLKLQISYSTSCIMSRGNEKVNDINSPVQTKETEVPGAELEVEDSTVDGGEKSDESSSYVRASFSCEQCEKTFSTRQELKEHTQTH